MSRTNKVRVENPQGGKGYLIRESLFEEGCFPENISLYARITLGPHSTLGYHLHETNAETYFVLKGEAIYNDNGEKRKIGPGEVTHTSGGRGHGIENDGGEEFVFMALIHEGGEALS
ncbi:MAG: cupin domain-containing protein [Lachnospiraceae bacterium]|nr:cupin domain-containing protein [Lachnospiraceae bacterium]